MIKICDMKNI